MTIYELLTWIVALLAIILSAYQFIAGKRNRDSSAYDSLMNALESSGNTIEGLMKMIAELPILKKQLAATICELENVKQQLAEALEREQRREVEMDDNAVLIRTLSERVKAVETENETLRDRVIVLEGELSNARDQLAQRDVRIAELSAQSLNTKTSGGLLKP